MSFNKRKMEAARKAVADAEAAARRATDAQVLEEAERTQFDGVDGPAGRAPNPTDR